MEDHEVRVHQTGLAFGRSFNAAVPFIDRHLDEGRADSIAIRTTAGDQVTYAELSEAVDRWGHTLRELGVLPGDRQLMVVQDGPEFFYLFWGAIKAGVIPVPLSTMLRAKDYRYLIEDSGAAVLVYSVACGGEVSLAVDQSEHRPAHVFTVATAMKRASEASATRLMPFPSEADDDAFWLYSSGSTGRPKGAVHRHRSLAITSQCYGVGVLDLRRGDVCYSAAKLFFAYGLGNAMSFPLWVGGTALLDSPKPTPQSTFEIIQQHRPSLYFGVPTLYAAQLAALETPETLASSEAGFPDLSSLRLCVSAGEALPAEILRRWRERTGLEILDGIGSTEALHIFLSNTPADVRAGSSGKPVPGYEARILDEQDEPVEPGASGRLQVRGASTASRYWDQREKTGETMLPGGWLETGDTYHQDADGYFVYEGRSDDMMKVGGIWTSPIEIESALIEHPRVLEAAVVARSDEHGLIKPEAWIVLRAGVTGDADLEDELRGHLKILLAPYKYPRWWHFVDDLPKTATGKIQRFKLREAVDGGGNA